MFPDLEGPEVLSDIFFDKVNSISNRDIRSAQENVTFHGDEGAAGAIWEKKTLHCNTLFLKLAVYYPTRTVEDFRSVRIEGHCTRVLGYKPMWLRVHDVQFYESSILGLLHLHQRSDKLDMIDDLVGLHPKLVPDI
jgi:hypothetical protein